jgi:hypothetical protein
MHLMGVSLMVSLSPLRSISHLYAVNTEKLTVNAKIRIGLHGIPSIFTSDSSVNSSKFQV